MLSYMGTTPTANTNDKRINILFKYTLTKQSVLCNKQSEPVRRVTRDLSEATGLGRYGRRDQSGRGRIVVGDRRPSTSRRHPVASRLPAGPHPRQRERTVRPTPPARRDA